MLEQLDHSKNQTVIERNGPGSGNNTEANDNDAAHLNDITRQPSAGSGSRVGVDPTATEWDGECGEAAWMKDRPRFGFYHELVHAYHNDRGDAEVWGGYQRAGCDAGVDQNPLAMPIGNWEWQTAGLGPWANESVSENAIRGQLGAPMRPAYSGRTWQPPPAQVYEQEEPPSPVHR